MKRSLRLSLFIIISFALFAQDAHQVLTNADIAKMVKSGMSDQTIVLPIQKGPTTFDTSPNTLIDLKKQGVSDLLLNAMIAAPSAGSVPSRAVSEDCSEQIEAVLDAVGPRDKLAAIHITRTLGTSTIGATSAKFERISSFPDKVYASVQLPNGLSTKFVITSDFNYTTSGKNSGAVPNANLDIFRSSQEFSPIAIAQHPQDYVCVADGTEQVGSVDAFTLKVSGPGRRIVYWSIDPTTARILQARFTAGSGEVVYNYSDWRSVNGLYFPFRSQYIQGGNIVESTISDYQLNPEIDPKLFDAPSQLPLSTEGDSANAWVNRSTTPATPAFSMLSDAEVNLALGGVGRDRWVTLTDVGGSFLNAMAYGADHVVQDASITLYTAEALLAIRQESAKRQFLEYVPTDDDRRQALMVVAHGFAIGTSSGPTSRSVTRIALVSDPSGKVVEEAYLSEPLGESWQNGFGATSRGQSLRVKFSMESVQRVKAAAQNGEFIVAVFAGTTRLKTYVVKVKHQKKLGM